MTKSNEEKYYLTIIARDGKGGVREDAWTYSNGRWVAFATAEEAEQKAQSLIEYYDHMQSYKIECE